MNLRSNSKPVRNGDQSANVGPGGGPMANLRAMIQFFFAVASRIPSALLRVAKRWAAPGAGPKLVSG